MKSCAHLRICAGLALLLWLTCGHAVAAPAMPPVTRHAPGVEAFPQNFAIAQDGAGVIYVGNSEGVLTFDGERWKLIPLPNHDVARSLAYDGHGRVYVGGYDEFGYLDRDAAGLETYHDLKPLYSALLAKGEQFADVWDTYVGPQGVYFRAVKHVFEYRPASQQVRVWRHEGRFGDITTAGNDLVLQFRGEGLKRLRGENWELIAGTESLKDNIYQLIHLPGGALLTLAADGRWQELRDGHISVRAMPKDFPGSSQFPKALELADGTIALAADDGTVQIYDPASGRARAFRVDSGSIVAICNAADGGLLAASDLAVFHIAWPNPWTVIGSDAGVSGSVHNLGNWNGRWYALTGNGVYRNTADTAGEFSFQRLDWTDHEAWELLPIDEHSALLAESYAVQLIEGGRARAITPATMYPRVFLRSRFDEGVVYVGTEMGIGVLKHTRGGWQLLLEHSTADSVLSSTLVESAPGEIWVGTERQGVQRLQLSDDRTHVLQAQSFGSGDGLSYGRLPAASVFALPEGGLVAATATGLFRWNGTRFAADALGGFAQMRAPDENLSFKISPAGEVWAWSFKHAYHRGAGGSWQRAQIANIRQGAIESLAFEESGSALLGVTNAILHYDPLQQSMRGRPPAVMLRSVEKIAPDGATALLPLAPATPLVLAQGESGLRFGFTLPDFRGRGAPRYQARLVGLDDKFSDWSDAKTYAYLHIDPGEYRFEVRARDAQGLTSEIAPYSFTVVPPWYARTWSRLLWGLLLVAAAALLAQVAARVRTSRLTAEGRRLKEMVAERTRDLEAANRRLDGLANIDGLTEVPNRRRLDQYLAHAWQACATHDQWLSVLVVDVDHFKTYNDQHGHLAGDDVLKQIVRVLAHSLRNPDDLVARFGGDEFVVVLPEAGLQAACDVAESMRSHVGKSGHGATVSVGVASCQPARGGAVAELVHEADEALYQAKNNGRNRIASVQLDPDE